MSVSSLVGIIGGIFGILSLIAGAAVYLRASYAKARIEALNSEVVEEKRRAEGLRRDVADLQALVAVQEAKIVALNELVTQRAQLDVMTRALEALRVEHIDLGKTLERILEKVSRGASGRS